MSCPNILSSILSSLHYFAHPHLPDMAVFDHVSPVIKVHLIAALIAFVIGAIQIFGPKGTGLHRVLGWTWILFMMTVAISSLFIRVINHGAFSVIHIFSGITIVAAPLVVYAARTHNVAWHKRQAISLYVGALVIAGLFTFFPGRLMWQMVFG